MEIFYSNGLTTFNWKPFDMVAQDCKEIVMKELNKRHIEITTRHYEIIWCAAKSGEYSTKSGYEVTTWNDEHCPWPIEIC